MGSHDRTDRARANNNPHKAVASRYGKWKAKLLSNPSLNQSIHNIGKNALSLFGYEPYNSISYHYLTTKNYRKIHPNPHDYQCVLTPHDCQQMKLSKIHFDERQNQRKTDTCLIAKG
jgi:hypothetical protein